MEYVHRPWCGWDASAVLMAVDLTEQLAGKTALQEAAAQVAERLLPKLVPAETVSQKKPRKP